MLLRLLAPLFLIAALVLPAAAQDRQIIVLDGSGSMWGQIDGTSKIEIARDVLKDVLASVPAENELGLVVYGHRTKGDCADIEVAVPVGAGTSGRIAEVAAKISPKGKTPLADAVKLAAETLKYTEDKATVVLVTDGIETCEADPCALAAELETAGVDFTTHVVGFGLSEEEGAQVACLAEATGGKYIQAGDAGALTDALTQTVAAAPAPEPEPAPAPEPEKLAPEFNVIVTSALSEDGPDTADIGASPFWEVIPVGSEERVYGNYGPGLKANLPAGDYKIRMGLTGSVNRTYPLSVTEGEAVDLHLILDAGIITVVPRASDTATEPDSAMFVKVEGAGADAGGYGKKTFYMPAGEITATASHAGAEASQTVKLDAGATVEVDLVVGTGVTVPSALYAPEGPAIEGSEIFMEVLSAKADLSGKRTQAAAGYGPNPLNVPAGEYVLKGRIGKAETISAPFTVKAGEATEVQIVLNAGVAAVSAPGAYRIDILSAKKDLQGKRKTIDGSYGEAGQWTLPAGSYVAVVTVEGSDVKAEAPVEVVAGERTEVTVE